MLDLGTVKPGSTVRIPFSSFDKDDGSSITMTNFATADILVYKNGSTTERASASGYTATTDFDAKTGKHLIVLDLADNTTANFWNAGAEYLVAVDAVTIDAVTTGGWVARFRIGYPNAILDTTIATLASQTSFTLTAGPAEDSALVGSVVVIHDIASAVQMGYGLITAYTGATKTVTLAAATTFTAAAGDNISVMPRSDLSYILGVAVSTSTAQLGVNAVQAGGTAWGSGAITANSIAADAITAAKIATGAIDADAIADGAIDAGAIAADAITAAKIATGAIDADAIAADAITAAKIADGAIDAATFAAGAINAAAIAADAIGASELAADAVAEIADAVWDEAMSGHVTAGTFGQRNYSARTGTAQAGAGTSITLDASASATNDIYNNHIVVITSGTGAGQARFITAYNGTTKVATVGTWQTNPDNTSVFMLIPFDSIPGATAPTAAQVADAVWDELLSGHAVSGSAGEALSAAGTAGDPWTTALPGAYGAGTAGKIIGDNINATISSRASQTSLDTLDDYVDTEVAAIKAKTDQLTFGTANRVDAQVYGVEAGAITAGAIAADAIGASELAADAVAEIADAVWDEATAGHVTAGSTGKAVVDILEDTSTTLDDLIDTEVAAILAAVDTEVAAIKTKTDFLPSATAGTNGGLPTVDANNYVAGIQGTLNQFDDLNNLSAAQVNAEVDSALDTAIPGSPTAGSINERIKTMDDADIPGRLPAALSGGKMDSVADVTAISGDTTAADKLEAALDGTVTATVNDAAATTTSFVTTLTSAVDDFYNGRIITFNTGALAGQQREITDYVGATKTVTVAALTSAPANGVAFTVT